MKPELLHDEIRGFMRPWRWSYGTASRENERGEQVIKIEKRGDTWLGLIWGGRSWMNGPVEDSVEKVQFQVDQLLLAKNCVLEKPFFPKEEE